MHRECKKDQSGPPSQTLVWIPNISFDDVKGSHLSTTILSSWTATVDIAYFVTFRFFLTIRRYYAPPPPLCIPLSLSSFVLLIPSHLSIPVSLSTMPLPPTWMLRQKVWFPRYLFFLLLKELNVVNILIYSEWLSICFWSVRKIFQTLFGKL